jgi:hypothetical protein
MVQLDTEAFNLVVLDLQDLNMFISIVTNRCVDLYRFIFAIVTGDDTVEASL